jgi:hypothetical protein
LHRSKGEEPSVRKYLKWIVVGLILAFAIAIEAYREKGTVPGAIVFSIVVVFFLYAFWRRR